jgi:hypothetical protein
MNDALILIIGQLDPGTSIRLSRLNKRFYKALSIRSKDIRLNKYNRVVRFFLCNIDNIEWNYLCYNSSIPIEFFEKHFDKINWYGLCSNPLL